MAFLTGQYMAGNNALRGGKREYSPKVRCGPWEEQLMEPCHVEERAPWFPHPQFLSTAEWGLANGVGIAKPRYGGGLPPKDDPKIDYSNVIEYDKTATAKSWTTNERESFTPPDMTLLAAASTPPVALKGNGEPKWSNKELADYRKRWTVEDDELRPVRFQTDAVISANQGASDSFQSSLVRKNPGAPLGLQKLRETILSGEAGKKRGNTIRPEGEQEEEEEEEEGKVRAVGILGIRRKMAEAGRDGDKLLQPRELQESLQELGLTLSDYDFRKIFAHFDVDENGVVSLNEIIKGVRGPMSQPRVDIVKAVFDKLDQEGKGILNVEDLQKQFQASCCHYSDASGCRGRASKEAEELDFLSHLELHRDAQADGGAQVTLECFLECFADVSANFERDGRFIELVQSQGGLQ